MVDADLRYIKTEPPKQQAKTFFPTGMHRRDNLAADTNAPWDVALRLETAEELDELSKHVHELSEDVVGPLFAGGAAELDGFVIVGASDPTFGWHEW